jgi:hypothetical protein
MFPPYKLLLLAFIVVTQLTYTPTCNTKPHMVRLVYPLDTLTVLGIRLDDDSIIPLSHDTSNVCQFLALEVFAYETLQRCACDFDVDRLFGHFVCPECKELQDFSIRDWIKSVPFNVSPRCIRA